MRSMAHVFPQLEESWAMDDQYMLGDALLVNPVTKKDAASWGVFLPGGDVWYDYETFKKMPSPGPGFAASSVHTIPVTLDKIPVFIRGGHILFRRERPRRSASAAQRDPYTVIIALDENDQASGLFYADDGVSYQHKDNGRYVLKRFEYANGILKSRDVDIVKELDAVVTLPPQAPMVANPEAQIRIERIVLIGVTSKVKEVKVWVGQGKEPLYFKQEAEGVIVVKDPKIPIGADEWKIEVLDGSKKTSSKDEL